MAGPARFGSEFRINASTAGNQDSASITALTGGKFAVAWEDDGFDGTNDIWARIYNADGTAFNGYSPSSIAQGPGNQQAAAIVGTADGRFVIAWEDYAPNPAAPNETIYSDINAQLFNADFSTPASGFYADRFRANINALHNQSQPSIAAAAGGRFMIGWSSLVQGDTDIYGRSYNAAQAFSGSATPIDNTVAVNETHSAMAGLTNGSYVSVWTDSGADGHGDGNGTHIRMRLIDGTGAVLPLPTYPIVNYYEAFDQTDPDVAALGNGNFVVVWTSEVSATDQDIRFRIFNSSGAPVTIDLAVPFSSARETQPAIAATGTGFVIAWTDADANDGSGTHIRAQMFNNDGTKLGTDFLVNQEVKLGNQSDPDIAALPDGRFVITWTDQGLDPSQGDASGNSVRGQIYDPRTAAVSLAGSVVDDDYIGTGFNDFMNGLAGNDTLAGGNGADTLGGGDGNDMLRGGAGADQLYGNAGNDTFVNPAGDLVSELANAGTDTVQSDVSFSLAAIANVERLFLTGGAAIDGNGNTLDNFMQGNAAANVLNGFEGADTLQGSGGNDRLNGAAGADNLTGGAGADRVAPGSDAVSDIVRIAMVSDSTGPGRDVIIGFDANAEDKIDLPAIPAAFNGSITTGTLNEASFNADLAAIVNATKLAAGNAVVFNPSGGTADYGSTIFLIVDANGVAGFQANADFVFQMEGHLGSFDTTDFI